MCVCVFQEEVVVSLGLATGEALLTLKEQLSGLLEQHQKTGHRRCSVQVHTHTHTHTDNTAHT